MFCLKKPASIRVTFHLEPNRITASHRHFLTPPHSQEQGYILTFDPQAVSGYQVPLHTRMCHYCYHTLSLSLSLSLSVWWQVDPSAPEPKSQDLFQQLESLMAAQEDIISQVSSPSLPPSLTLTLSPSLFPPSLPEGEGFRERGGGHSGEEARGRG